MLYVELTILARVEQRSANGARGERASEAETGTGRQYRPAAGAVSRSAYARAERVWERT